MKQVKHYRSAVVWKDLRQLSRRQIRYNIFLPYPFLLASLVVAATGYYVVAMALSFLFFAASFRQAHDGFHQTLGVSPPMTDKILFLSSCLILTSNHAIRATHLAHHRAPLSAADIEAKYHQLPWYQAIIGGTPFWLSLQYHGYRLASPKQRRFIVTELSLIILIISGTVLTGNHTLIYHVLVMCVGNSLVGFVAGWCVHHDCDDEVIARTERNAIANHLTFNLLYHQEHHLFPCVPSNHLPILAARLDAAAPELTARSVLPQALQPLDSEKIKRKNPPLFLIDIKLI